MANHNLHLGSVSVKAFADFESFVFFSVQLYSQLMQLAAADKLRVGLQISMPTANRSPPPDMAAGCDPGYDSLTFFNVLASCTKSLFREKDFRQGT